MTRRVYLAGAIDRVERSRAEEWRAQAKRTMGDFDLVAVDPLAEVEDSWSDDEIVNRDRYLLGQSDAVLVDGRTPGFGTGCEIQTAYDLSIPVVVWGVSPPNAGVWLRHHCVYATPNLAEAVEYIAGLLL